MNHQYYSRSITDKHSCEQLNQKAFNNFIKEGHKANHNRLNDAELRELHEQANLLNFNDWLWWISNEFGKSSS